MSRTPQSKYEAWTVGTTKVGTLAKYETNNGSLADGRHTVGRHIDGKNNTRSGFNHVIVVGIHDTTMDATILLARGFNQNGSGMHDESSV